MFRSSATSIQLKPLVPTSSDPLSPQCTLLRLESLTLLLDCGSDLAFSESVRDAVRPHAHEIDAVLVSSSELSCCGSLPLVLPLLRPGVKIIATMATARLGVMNVASHFLSLFGNADELMSRIAPEKLGTANESPRAPPPDDLSVKSIYAAFRSIRETHFDQTVTVLSVQHGGTAEESMLLAAKAAAAAQGNNNGSSGLTATTADQATEEIIHASVRAVAAGRCVGGAGFRIQYRDDDILYLGRFAPRDSAVLPGLDTAPTAQGALTGVNIIICDGSAANVNSNAQQQLQQQATSDSAQQQQQDENNLLLPPTAAVEKALRTVRDTLRKGGTVLLPLNAFGVGIEIMHRLEQYFADEALSYPLVFASPKAREHVERLRLLSEFVLPSANWARSEGPLSSYTLVSSPTEATNKLFGGAAAATSTRTEARCIVVHTHDCRDWLSALLLQQVATDPRNCILFTEPHSPAAYRVRDAVMSRKPEIMFRALTRTVLEGQELEAFQQEDRARRDAEDLAAEAARARQREVEAATELTLLQEQEDELLQLGGGTQQQQKHQQATSSAQQLQQQHPGLYIASTFEVKKRVKPTVLGFPGELSYSSTRTLQDFGTAAAANSAAALSNGAKQGAGNTNNSSNNAGGGGSNNNNNNKQQQNNSKPTSTAMSEEEAAIYGIPVSDADMRRFRRIAAESIYFGGGSNSNSSGNTTKSGANNNDQGNNNDGRSTAESADEIPAYINEKSCVIKVAARVESLLTVTQWLDGTSLRLMLRNSCKGMRKLAFLHASDDDARALEQFCVSEGICSKRGCIVSPRAGDELDLATAVFSCEIRLHPTLLQQISAQQRPVGTQSGSWQIAWVRGVLRRGSDVYSSSSDNRNSAVAAANNAGTRRQREQDNNQQQQQQDNRPVLCPVDDAVAQQYTNHQPGSIYVGELRLPYIERDLIQRGHLRDVTIELDDEAPLLVAGNAVAIRGGTKLAMEAVPSAAMFAARKALRSSFSHIL